MDTEPMTTTDDVLTAEVSPMRKALMAHGWYVADVIDSGWVESSDWEPVLLDAARQQPSVGLTGDLLHKAMLQHRKDRGGSHVIEPGCADDIAYVLARLNDEAGRGEHLHEWTYSIHDAARWCACGVVEDTPDEREVDHAAVQSKGGPK